MAELIPECPDDIDLARLGAILRESANLRSWLKAIEQRARALILAGRGDEIGFKLVAGDAGDRGWLDEKSATRTLLAAGIPATDIITPPSLGSPAQVEKVIRSLKLPRKASRAIKDEMAKEIKKGAPGAPVMVPVSDPRPSILTDPADDFDPIA